MAIGKILLAITMEGLSIPFPGSVFILGYSNAEKPGILEIIMLSVIMATIYTAMSFVPYYIGSKLGNKVYLLLGEKFKTGCEKGSGFLNKYGAIAVGISRPFGFGNYMSYLGGIIKMDKLKYGGLTFVGIFPWCFMMLNLGKIHLGKISEILGYFQKYSVYVCIAALLFAAVYLTVSIMRYRKLDRDEI